jgi:plastocyanin
MPGRPFPPCSYPALAALLLALTALPAGAGTLLVSVADADGFPVPDVAVYVVQDGVPAAARAAPATAIMDQRDTRFVPHILVVQKGTAVEFPNSDVVAHHVYSFSKPNNFVLPLYKGDPHEPVTFVHDGIVTLGCNIHDQMLGYIVVVDTDVFGMTDSAGAVSLAVDDTATAYRVTIWSPRIRDAKESLTRVLPRTAERSLRFALQKKLRPPHDTGTESVQWSEY